MSDPVLLTVSESVATITLNRPDALNSLTLDAKVSLLEAVSSVSANPAIRAVVLTGAGRAFCAGQDLREHATLLSAGDNAPLNTVREHFNPIVLGIAEMPKPVIAAVNGTAAGAGASLAFAADFRIAAESASFMLAFANVGLSLDSGASWTLPRLIGHARATAMALLADQVTATHALDMGLVNAVVPDDMLLTTATELAVKLAAGPTAAYAAIKESIRYAWTSTLRDALDKEAELQTRAGETDDHRNATAAFVNRQPRTFLGH